MLEKRFKCCLLKDILFNAHCSRRYVARGAKMKVPTPDPHTEIPGRRQYHCLTWIGIRIEKTCSESSLWVKIVADSNNGWQIDQAKTEATQDSIKHLRISITVTNQFVVDLLNNDDHKVAKLLTYLPSELLHLYWIWKGWRQRKWSHWNGKISSIWILYSIRKTRIKRDLPAIHTGRQPYLLTRPPTIGPVYDLVICLTSQ